MARTSRTPFVILGILGILEEKPLSGYDIKHIIVGSISHFWSESYGQIYPVLKQLAAEKFIRAQPVKESGTKKIIYSITARGKKKLAAWMEKPPQRGPMRDELILKIFFGSMTSIPVLKRHLTAYRDQSKAMFEQYAGYLSTLAGEHESYTPFQLLTLRGGIAMCKAFMDWANESLETLKQMEDKK